MKRNIHDSNPNSMYTWLNDCVLFACEYNLKRYSCMLPLTLWLTHNIGVYIVVSWNKFCELSIIFCNDMNVYNDLCFFCRSAKIWPREHCIALHCIALDCSSHLGLPIPRVERRELGSRLVLRKPWAHLSSMLKWVLQSRKFSRHTPAYNNIMCFYAMFLSDIAVTIMIKRLSEGVLCENVMLL